MRALGVSTAGLAIAILISRLSPGNAFVYLLGVSLFGGLYTWLVIFVTHVRFRYRNGVRGTRLIGSGLGALAIVAILLTTWWVESMRITLVAGISWLATLSTVYAFVRLRPAKLS